ncbi:MAG: xanthine dehydrogenase family protein molybdopterin-binding subunit, partial [Spongiibacteraceae bacterium]|nr:xanthine dehydrogenase family protein molybdopterin-binding subunit [Spongiibacteraceae bacterium]
MNQTIQNESRRRFLKSTAGLTLALYLPLASGKNIDTTTTFEPNAFLRIAEDNSVTVIAKHLEMGQGTYTGLATLVAEELDAAWSQVRVEAAPANAKRYSNLNWGAQGTGGSSAINNSWEQMRQAGASARAMLVMAAAKRWNVATKDIHVVGGVLSHSASGKTANFGQLASAAAEQAVPEQVTLKKPKDFKLIGQQHLPRKDSKAKTNGSAIYTQDIHLPNMLTAVVAHPPRFGGKVKSFNASKSLEIKGVVEVVQIPSGVAVLATGTWAAKKGRDALHIEWDETTAFKQSSDDLIDQYKTLAKSPGTIARQEGNADKALTNASQTLEAEYDFPYLAHAAMEPMNCVIKLSKDRCETWYGAQLQTADQAVLAKIFALQPEQVHINTLYAGGSFGRRASKNHDYIIEAAHIVKASDTHAPVKLVWMREDDTQAGNYRPMFHHRLKAGLDNKGNLVSWQHRLVGQSIMANSPFEGSIKNGIDPTSVEGAMNLPYAIANIQVDLHSPNIAVPIQWWRVVGSSHTA